MTWARQVATFVATAKAVASIVDDIPDPTMPGLGEWDLHALAAHTLRALTTLQGYLGEPEPADEPPLADASAYFAAYLEMRSVDPVRVDTAVAERGRSGAAALSVADIARRFDDLAEALDAELTAAGPDRLIVTPWGAIRLGDYLRTRSFELVVHGLDLVAASGSTQRLPDASTHDALSLLTEIAHRRGLVPELIRTLTGRDGADVLPLLQ